MWADARRPFRRWWLSRRVEVRDESMRPTLLPGDRLRIDRSAYRDRFPIPGELVVLVDPEAPGRWLVKRVGSLVPRPPETWIYVVGDAIERARDSRTFGPVPPSAIVGRVYRRYAPAGRRCDL